MFKCEICGREFETNKKLAFHIPGQHKIKTEEYYLKFIGEKGKCKECGKDTRFVGLQSRYLTFCSIKCRSANLEIKQKYKNTCMKNSGYENPMQNPEILNKAYESKLKNNNGIDPRKLTYKKLKERYPLLVEVEELIEGPNGEIMGHCKNSNCKNSKENGGYFEPTIYQLNWRKQGIDKNDTYYLYCCEECKKVCPLYHKSAAVLHNLMNENSEIPYTQEEYNIWHEEVLYRQRIENNTDINFCEKCHATEKLHVHHEVPKKIVPGYALDPINGIVFCEDCHYKIGHEKGTECSTGNLANKICK
jgi:endogenous inhibitor of DNA gyrase (YacG/DUF329 family)